MKELHSWFCGTNFWSTALFHVVKVCVNDYQSENKQHRKRTSCLRINTFLFVRTWLQKSMELLLLQNLCLNVGKWMSWQDWPWSWRQCEIGGLNSSLECDKIFLVRGQVWRPCHIGASAFAVSRQQRKLHQLNTCPPTCSCSSSGLSSWSR